jgi:hypothetical protein
MICNECKRPAPEADGYCARLEGPREVYARYHLDCWERVVERESRARRMAKARQRIADHARDFAPCTCPGCRS